VDEGTPQGGPLTPRTQKVTFNADPEFAVWPRIVVLDRR
jgi:hypothetical protein